MFEVILGCVLALNLMMMGALWLKNNEMSEGIRALGLKIGEGIDDIQIDLPDLDELKHEIMGIFQNMHTPNFMDHIGGAIGAILQAKAMKSMQNLDPALEMVNMHGPDSEGHG